MITFLIGLISGIISGLGMGGGTILILLLTLLMNLDQHITQATNLIFFIPTAIVACIVNSKQKIIDYKTGIKLIIFGIIGAVLGANLSFKINSQNLKKYFGIFLLVIESYEIITIVYEYIKKRKNK